MQKDKEIMKRLDALLDAIYGEFEEPPEVVQILEDDTRFTLDEQHVMLRKFITESETKLNEWKAAHKNPLWDAKWMTPRMDLLWNLLHHHRKNFEDRGCEAYDVNTLISHQWHQYADYYRDAWRFKDGIHCNC